MFDAHTKITKIKILFVTNELDTQYFILWRIFHTFQIDCLTFNMSTRQILFLFAKYKFFFDLNRELRFRLEC